MLALTIVVPDAFMVLLGLFCAAGVFGIGYVLGLLYRLVFRS